MRSARRRPPCYKKQRQRRRRNVGATSARSYCCRPCSTGKMSSVQLHRVFEPRKHVSTSCGVISKLGCIIVRPNPSAVNHGLQFAHGSLKVQLQHTDCGSEPFTRSPSNCWRMSHPVAHVPDDITTSTQADIASWQLVLLYRRRCQTRVTNWFQQISCATDADRAPTWPHNSY